MRILVVDDVADAADTLAELLRMKDLKAVSVHSGIWALQHMQEWRPHVLLCDLAMPEMDGLSVARQVREHPELQDVVLVAWSGYTDQATQRQAAEAGFDHFLPKPTEPDQLFALLQRIATELSRR